MALCPFKGFTSRQYWIRKQYIQLVGRATNSNELLVHLTLWGHPVLHRPIVIEHARRDSVSQHLVRRADAQFRFYLCELAVVQKTWWSAANIQLDAFFLPNQVNTLVRSQDMITLAGERPRSCLFWLNHNRWPTLP